MKASLSRCPAMKSAVDSPAVRASLRALVIEDSSDDVLLLTRHLQRHFELFFTQVDDPEALSRELAGAVWDVVLSDYSMPGFSGLDALALVREHDPDMPFIIVSGNIGEDVAVDAMRAGANDYVLKGSLVRLVPAIEREMHEARRRRSRGVLEQALSESETRLNSVLESLDDVIWSVTLPAIHLAYLSPATEKVYQRRAGEFVGHLDKWLAAVHPDDRARMKKYLDDIRAAGSGSAEYRILWPNGSERWLHDRARLVTDADGHPIRIDGITSDITERKRNEALLAFMNNHDALTRLPNRNLLLDRLQQSMARKTRNAQPMAVVHLDLGRFKLVNEALGHEAGDRLLVAVAKRLNERFRQGDTVARVGGNEFVVVLPDMEDMARVTLLAQEMLGLLSAPFEMDGKPVHVPPTLGVAVFPEDGSEAELLLQHAESAMRQGKQLSPGGMTFFSSEYNTEAQRRIRLEHDLHDALGRGELHLLYQPQVDLGSGRIIGFEALLRWQHPEHGLIPPMEFVPIAEDNGLIVPIGRWVLETACREAIGWGAQHQDLRISVNLSARQFLHSDLVGAVREVLANTGLPPRQLELELTETLVMRDIEASIHTMASLRSMGVTLAVDDFGTGYSSLGYLKRFPVDRLKIDKSFVQDISSEPNDAAICATVVTMAHALGLRVIAEGVETEGQKAFLTEQRCDAMQGYLFSRPIDSAAARELLAAGRRLDVAEQATAERTLLLLDDEESILAAIRRLLRRDGYRVLTASTPEDAFDFLAANPVGVVISDQRMPTMSGTEFLRRVRGLYPDTIRMVLSGYADLESVASAINEGAIFRFMTKPWEDDQLREIIKAAFEQHEMSAELARLNHENADARLRLQQLLDDQSHRLDREEAVLAVLREAIENLPVPTLAIDEYGVLALANAAMVCRFPFLALLGEPAAEVLPPELLVLLGQEGDHPVAFSDSQFLCHLRLMPGRGQLLFLTEEKTS